MLKNYFKIAVRSLFRNKIFSLINIIGLAIGLSASVMMLLIVEHEYSYDKHNEKIDRVGRLIVDRKNLDTKLNFTPPILGPTLEENFPEIESYARAHSINPKVKINENKEERINLYSVDSSITDVLTFEFLEGNKENLYNRKEWTLLSQSKAKQYFGDENPIGKTLEIQIGKFSYLLSVTGVYKDIPETSTFKSGILVPFYIGLDEINNRFKRYEDKKSGTVPADSWKSRCLITYVLLNGNASFNRLNEKVEPFTEKMSEGQHQAAFSIQPLNEVYLNSQNIVGLNIDQGDEQKVFIYTLAAFLLLIISIINYIMLSSAKLADKIFEIGIRKVIGATRKSLITQITLEAILITLIAIPISAVLIYLGILEFSNILGINISLDYLNTFGTYFGLILLSIAVSILSGFFVSNRISKLNPSLVLQNKKMGSTNKIKLRHAFVLVQMVVFVSLVIGAISVKYQIEYLKNKNLGFNTENVLILDLERKNRSDYFVLKEELKSLPQILNVTATGGLPPKEAYPYGPIKRSDSEEDIMVHGLSGDYDFIATMGMEIIKGRGFSNNQSFTKEWLLNETAVRELNLGDDLVINVKNKKIIGVVKDFNFQPLYGEVKPLLIRCSDKSDYFDDVVIRFKSENLSQTIADIEEVWSKVYPNAEMKYRFFDEIIDKLYTKEKNFSTVINTFTALALLITCLGLFGLIIFISEQRTKEIGIRKVLGASVHNILGLLSKEFVILEICASVIASPLAYYFINMWLENFAYRTEIGMEIFIYAGLLALVISLTTIGLNSIKAALANPVESLRNE